MLQGLIFDLDGVIVNSHPDHRRVWRTFFASLGRQYCDDELEFVVEGHKREDILRHFLGPLPDEQLKDYGARKEALFRASTPELETVKGLDEFLRQAEQAGLPMAVASSGGRERVEYTLKRLQFRERFSVIVTCKDVQSCKPDPAIFHAAAEGLGVRPSGILVCEDAVNGVEAAKKAGMRCLAIAANGRTPLLHQAGADKIVPDFTAANLGELRTLFV
jgi:HAD superfamily hydrolase (TIGR01509 family)